MRFRNPPSPAGEDVKTNATDLDSAIASVAANIKQLGEQVNQRFDRLEKKVDKLDDRVKAQAKGKLGEMDKRADAEI